MVYYGGQNEIGRALIRFNLAAAVPPEAIIDAGRLDLFLEYGEGANPINLVAGLVTEDWVESEVTWNNQPATGEPFLATLVDTSSGYKSLDVTNIVRAWHNVPHYGLELQGPEEETVFSRVFESREHGEMPPRLVVTYHLPTYVLSGRVYAGDIGDESTPLSGVTVELYGSNNPGVLGSRIAGTTTDSSGWYGLTVSGSFEFYNIVETDPFGYTSVGATSVGGTVINSNWIQYTHPLEGKTLTGNKFWDRPAATETPTPTVTPTATRTPTATGTATATPTLTPTPTWLFEGRVYEGEVGDESRPLQGVTVSLHGANAPYPDLGTIITSTTTDGAGWYGLPVPGGYEYYSIRETDPLGYISVGATTLNGTVRTANWIEFAAPLAGQDLTGNKFWDRLTPTPTTMGCTSCTDCSNKLNGAYNIIYLQNDLTGITGPCVLFGASNVTFDCQGHTIAGDHPGEFSYGICMVGRNGNTIRNCTVSGFETGISLMSSNNSYLISNTVRSNSPYGIRLQESDGNDLSGNSLTQNQIGVDLISADSNAFANNVICKQIKQDIYGSNATAGNTRSGDKCDFIYNWNGSNSIDKCAQTCTPNITTTCASGTACQNALNGDFNYVALTGDMTVPSGITVGGNHLTLDCAGYTITGGGAGAGIVLDNKIGITVQNCTIRSFYSGIELRSGSLNTIQGNTVTSNTVGVLLRKTEPVLRPEQNTIYNNALTGNSLYGLQLSDAINNSISSNDMRNNGNYALWVSGECNDTVNNNTGGNGGNLLYWHDLPVGGSIPAGSYDQVTLCNVHHATVENLRIDNGPVKNDGILLVDSSTIHVCNNWLTYTNGIAVISSTHVSIYSNDVFSSQNHAVSLEYSQNASVYTNTLHDNPGSGIFVGIGTGGTEVFSNAVRSNSRGIEINNTDNVTVTGNIVQKSTGEGIAVNGATGVALSGNTISRNNVGLFFDEKGGQSTATNNEVCYNTAWDIFNGGKGNTGSNNTCAKSWAWQDAGATSGCSLKCIGWYQYNYGYQFQNSSKYPLSFGCPWGRCQGDYVDTFGEDQVYMSVPICIGIPLCIPWVGCKCLGWEKTVSTGIPDPHASIYYAAAYHHSGKPGECTGMSTTSLRFYRGERYVSQYNSSAQKVSDLTYAGNLENEIDAAHGAIVSLEIAAPYLDWYREGGQSPNEVLSLVKQGIQNNQPGSIVMMDGLTTAHTVVAAEVRDYGNTAHIYVYDSNYPQFSTQYADDENTYPHITVDKVANTFQYSKNANFSVMWFLPYSIANGSFTIPLGWKQVLFSGWGSANTQVEDEGGHVIGWQGDVFTNTIPGAAPMFDWGSRQPSGHDFYILPPGGYTAHIAGREHGNYDAAIFHANSTVLLDGVPATPATHDTLTFNYEYDNPPTVLVTFETLDAGKPYSLTIGEKFAPSGGVRLYSIRHARIAAGSRAVFRVIPDFSGLIYTNRGPEPIAYIAEMQSSMVSPTVQVGDVLPTASQTGLVIEPMSTHVLVPDNWLDLGKSQIHVFMEQCGNGGCGFGEGPYNCPEDCGEFLPCVQPHDDMAITQTTTLCPGVYEISDTGAPGVLNVAGNGVTLDCGGAKLVGNGAGVGILSGATSQVTITNCYVQSYTTGIVLNGVLHGTVFQSALVSNTWGVQLNGGEASHLTRNYVWGNGSGIQLVGVNGTALSQNLVCANQDVDIQTSGGAGNTGFDNACEHTAGWNDLGRSGCTFRCRPLSNVIYLPVVLKNH